MKYKLVQESLNIEKRVVLDKRNISENFCVSFYKSH